VQSRGNRGPDRLGDPFDRLVDLANSLNNILVDGKEFLVE
jgi:hypothetical protein